MRPSQTGCVDARAGTTSAKGRDLHPPRGQRGDLHPGPFLVRFLGRAALRKGAVAFPWLSRSAWRRPTHCTNTQSPSKLTAHTGVCRRMHSGASYSGAHCIPFSEVLSQKPNPACLALLPNSFAAQSEFHNFANGWSSGNRVLVRQKRPRRGPFRSSRGRMNNNLSLSRTSQKYFGLNGSSFGIESARAHSSCNSSCVLKVSSLSATLNLTLLRRRHSWPGVGTGGSTGGGGGGSSSTTFSCWSSGGSAGAAPSSTIFSCWCSGVQLLPGGRSSSIIFSCGPAADGPAAGGEGKGDIVCM